MPKTQKKYGVRRRPNTRKKYRKSKKKLNNVRKNKSHKITRKRRRRQRGGVKSNYRGTLTERAHYDKASAALRKAGTAGKIPTPKKLKVAEARAVEKALVVEEAARCFCSDACTTENPCIRLEACCKAQVHKECIVTNVLASSDVGSRCPYCNNDTTFFEWAKTLLTPEELEQLPRRKQLVDPYLDLPTGNNGGGGAGAGNNSTTPNRVFWERREAEREEEEVLRNARQQLSPQEIRAMASLGMFARR